MYLVISLILQNNTVLSNFFLTKIINIGLYYVIKGGFPTRKKTTNSWCIVIAIDTFLRMQLFQNLILYCSYDNLSLKSIYDWQVESEFKPLKENIRYFKFYRTLFKRSVFLVNNKLLKLHFKQQKMLIKKMQ